MADLVCLFLRHAVVAGDRTAVRRSVRHTLWAVRRWTRLGLWRRLLTEARRTGGSPAVIPRNRAPSSSIVDPVARRRVALTAASTAEEIGASRLCCRRQIQRPLAIDVSPADQHDTKGIVPVLRSLADGGFQGPALGDLGYRSERLAKAGEALGITVEAIARGRDGRFVPAGVCWVVERSFAWLSRYRRLNTIFERSKDHLVAFVAIAFIPILTRRLKRIIAEDFSA